MATNPWGSVRRILGTPGTASYENRLNNLYGRNASFGSYGQLPGYFTTEFNSPDRSINLALAMNDGTDDLEHLQSWAEFDRFYAIDTTIENPSGRHYIFFCRPDLYLVVENGGGLQLSTESRVAYDPYFNYIAVHHPQIIGSLTGEFAGITGLTKTSAAAATGSGYGNSISTDGTRVKINGVTRQLTIHAFIPYLTSRVESLQLPDYTIKQNTLVQPYTKYSIPYTTSAIESSTGGTFDITFREDRYFSIHKLFYGWLYYMNGVMRNIFRPKDRYLMYNALDYATSIYDFIVDDTGENVVYWAKYTGVIPTSVPMSDLSFNRGGAAETKVSVSFAYFYCEHMNQEALVDFNYNSMGYICMNTWAGNNKLHPVDRSQTLPIYDADTFLGKNFTGRPVVLCETLSNGRPVIKLRWLP